MPAFLRPRFWRALWRGICVVGSLLAHLAATLPIPLPAAPVHKDVSQAFPCQDHPCGCQTAEQCWRHCCCFTVEERWAWARARNVQPPAYAEKPAEQGWNTAKLRDRTGSATKGTTRSCCAAKNTCGQSDTPARSAKSCCQADSARQEKKTPPSGKGIRWTLGMSALGCQGVPSSWVSAGVVAPMVPPLTWTLELPLAAQIPSIEATPSEVCLNPPAPPPRLSMARST